MALDARLIRVCEWASRLHTIVVVSLLDLVHPLIPRAEVRLVVDPEVAREAVHVEALTTRIVEEVPELVDLGATLSPEGAHPTSVPPPVGGRLMPFWQKWQEINPGPWVLEVVRHGYKIEFTTPPPEEDVMRVTQVPTDPEKRKALEHEISELVRKRAVFIVDSGSLSPLYRSTFFLTPKRPGVWRPIINLKGLNKAYIVPQKFRMESLAAIIPQLKKGMWGASLDLRDAYLHIPMHAECQRYLAFNYGGVDMCFKALPFGLSTAAPGVYACNTVRDISSTEQGSGGLCLPGRLADRGLFGGKSGPCITGVYGSSSRPGMVDQRREVGSRPKSRDSIPRGSSRLQIGKGVPIRQADRGLQDFHRGVPADPGPSSFVMATTPGLHGELYGGGSSVSSSHETDTISCPTALHAVKRPPHNPDSLGGKPKTGHSLVGAPGVHKAGTSVPGSSSSDFIHDGCLPVRLGGLMGGQIDIGGLVGPGGHVPHQLVGAGDSEKGSPPLVLLPSGPSGDSIFGQYYDSGLHQQRRGNSVVDPVSDGDGSSVVMSRKRHRPTSDTPSRGRQHHGGCPVQGDIRSQQLVPERVLCEADLLDVRVSACRPICGEGELPSTDLLQSCLGEGSVGNGRPVIQLGEFDGVRLPSTTNDPTRTKQGGGVQRGPTADSPVLAEPVVVSRFF